MRLPFRAMRRSDLRIERSGLGRRKHGLRRRDDGGGTAIERRTHGERRPGLRLFHAIFLAERRGRGARGLDGWHGRIGELHVVAPAVAARVARRRTPPGVFRVARVEEPNGWRRHVLAVRLVDDGRTGLIRRGSRHGRRRRQEVLAVVLASIVDAADGALQAGRRGFGVGRLPPTAGVESADY
jgi:hypothetical protein